MSSRLFDALDIGLLVWMSMLCGPISFFDVQVGFGWRLLVGLGVSELVDENDCGPAPAMMLSRLIS